MCWRPGVTGRLGQGWLAARGEAQGREGSQAPSPGGPSSGCPQVWPWGSWCSSGSCCGSFAARLHLSLGRGPPRAGLGPGIPDPWRPTQPEPTSWSTGLACMPPTCSGRRRTGRATKVLGTGWGEGAAEQVGLGRGARGPRQPKRKANPAGRSPSQAQGHCRQLDSCSRPLCLHGGRPWRHRGWGCTWEPPGTAVPPDTPHRGPPGRDAGKPAGVSLSGPSCRTGAVSGSFWLRGCHIHLFPWEATSTGSWDRGRGVWRPQSPAQPTQATVLPCRGPPTPSGVMCPSHPTSAPAVRSRTCRWGQPRPPGEPVRRPRLQDQRLASNEELIHAAAATRLGRWPWPQIMVTGPGPMRGPGGPLPVPSGLGRLAEMT